MMQKLSWKICVTWAHQQSTAWNSAANIHCLNPLQQVRILPILQLQKAQITLKILCCNCQHTSGISYQKCCTYLLTKMNPTQVVWRDARSIIITVSSGEVRLILMSLMKMKPTSYHRFCFHAIFLLCFINKILLAASHGTQHDHHRSSTVDTVIHERLFGTFM